jgi:hypothetical protein
MKFANVEALREFLENGAYGEYADQLWEDGVRSVWDLASVGSETRLAGSGVNPYHAGGIQALAGASLQLAAGRESLVTLIR